MILHRHHSRNLGSGKTYSLSAQSSDLQRSGTRAVQQVWFQGRSIRLLPISGFTDRGYWIGTAVVMHRVGKDKLVFLIISM